MKISSITMKKIYNEETYFRMSVMACELPEWIYLKAKDMDCECYLEDRTKQFFEIEGYVNNHDYSVSNLEVVYFWDSYETIAEVDPNIYNDIYKVFSNFAIKYGERLPDNGELCLGDCEYKDLIPQEVKEEWKKENCNLKKVKQISIDMLVDEVIDGEKLSEDIVKTLEKAGHTVLGSAFIADITKTYEKSFPDLLEY